MASLKTKFAVGLFLAAGIALTIGAVIWLGMSHYFERGHRYAAYFDDSVQGLAKDSPVKYRGVPVGRVERIGVAPDARLIEVVIMFDQELKPEERIDKIVAQLKTIGITGIMFIELDQREKTDPDLSPKLSFTPKYPVVPTKPSEITKLLKNIDDVIKQFQTVELDEISNKIKLTLDNFSRLAEDADVKAVSADIRAVLGKIDRVLNAASSLEKLIARGNQTIRRLEGLIARNEPRIDASIQHLKSAIEHADGTVKRFDSMLVENQSTIRSTVTGFAQTARQAGNLMHGGTGLIQNIDDRLSDLQLDLRATTQNLKIASENLNQLVEMVTDQPSQLLFGKPVPARKVEEDNSGQ